MDYINMQLKELARLEAIAYAAGDAEKASILAAVAELIEEKERLEDLEDDLQALKKETADHADYKAFFEDCFEMLDGHYPCPSVTSDYDKSIVFDAIRKGEGVEE